MFKCPVCGNRHRINDGYDNQDYECPNSNKPTTFQDLKPTNQLTRAMYWNNRASVLEDDNRPVTIMNPRPSYREDGTSIDTERKNNY